MILSEHLSLTLIAICKAINTFSTRDFSYKIDVTREFSADVYGHRAMGAWKQTNLVKVRCTF